MSYSIRTRKLKFIWKFLYDIQMSSLIQWSQIRFCFCFCWNDDQQISNFAATMNANDKNNSAIFSLRIVSIDNYMRAPLFGLDTCYSEFRADEVKQVSVHSHKLSFIRNVKSNWFAWTISCGQIGAGHPNFWYRCKWNENMCPCSWCFSIFVCAVCWRRFNKRFRSFGISIGCEFG